MVWLGAPLVLIGDRLVKVGTTNAGTLTQRSRRHVLVRRSVGNTDPTLGSPTYIDTLGVPRGVPNKYQVASGFENIPVL